MIKFHLLSFLQFLLHNYCVPSTRNLRTGFRDYLKSEGIYVVKPTEAKTSSTKSTKLLSVEGLKRALRSPLTDSYFNATTMFLSNLKNVCLYVKNAPPINSLYFLLQYLKYLSTYVLAARQTK